MGGRTFDCLESVVDRYRTEQIVEGHTLGHPVKKVLLYRFKKIMSVINWLN